MTLWEYMCTLYDFDVNRDIKDDEIHLVNNIKYIKTKIENLKETVERKNKEIKIFEHEITKLKQPIIKRREKEKQQEYNETIYNTKLNQIKLSKSPLFTEMESNDACNFIDYYKDCDQDGKHFRFGDIVDTDGYRHYNYQFVGKSGILKNSTRYNDYRWNIECGIIVPLEITRYLTDSLAKYKVGQNCVVIYELPYWDKTVQKYDVPEDNLYEYRFDFDESDWVGDPNGPWDLWVIPLDFDGNNGYKAELKTD